MILLLLYANTPRNPDFLSGVISIPYASIRRLGIVSILVF